MDRPAQSGRGILLRDGSEVRLNGDFLTQHGCSSPQGIAAGESMMNNNGSNAACAFGQQE